jgi:hypothetical protein
MLASAIQSGEETMPRGKLSLTLAITWVAAPTLALFLGAGAAKAQSNSANYTFLVAAGFLCDSADSSTCPAVVKSANDDSYEITGTGMLTTQSKTVTAAGTFTHKSSNGLVVETGIWIASELVSFDSYGIAPGALMREGPALGPRQIDLSSFGPNGLGMFSGSMATGGLAVLRIRLLPVRGLSRNATLQVNCALGKVSSEHSTEGIRLALEGGGVEYDEEVSGRALFLLASPGASAAAKAPVSRVYSEPLPTETQQ